MQWCASNHPVCLSERSREPMMHIGACPIYCRVHCWVDRKLGLCRLISVQPLIRSTIRAFFRSSALCGFDVLCCLYWHSFYQTDNSTLWWMVVKVNWLRLYQQCRRAVFWARYCSSCTLRSFFPFWKISWSVMLMSPLWPFPGTRVTVAVVWWDEIECE